ncbi:MAG: sigma-70 family RNA polymerase sigma factor [Pirellulaceae bacterium]
MSDTGEPDWDKLIERHAERVFRIAFRILGSVHDAEDISQDVFTEAMSIHRAASVRTWTGLMVRLATMRSIDRLRSNRKKPATLPNETSECLAVRPRQEQELIATELATWLRDEIRDLPDQQAVVFSLAYFEQLSRNEIASAIDISPEAVSTTLYKARKRLSERLTVIQGDRT